MEEKKCLYCGTRLKEEENNCPKCQTAYHEIDPKAKDKKIVLYKNRRNHITGFIGGLIGGMIASVPWILAEIYGGFYLSILAGLIAIGVRFGYKKCLGKYDVWYPRMIIILSVLIVAAIQIIVIPAYYLNIGNMPYTIENIWLVIAGENATTFIFNFGLAMLFTFIGIAKAVSDAKDEVVD